MSTRLSRRAAVAVGLSIVAIMLVWAPMGALADSGNSNAPTEPPGNSAAAPGLADDGTAPGNSENAPGQAETAAVTTTDAAPGNSGDAPGQTKTDSGPPETSNAGGNSDKSAPSTSGGSGGHNGNNVPDDDLDDGVGGGVGNSEEQDKDRPSDASNGPGTGQQKADTCTNDQQGAIDTGHGANQGSVYDNTCDGRPSDNGQGGGDATGRPCMGCVGNADDKNPGANNGNGQYPGPKNDRRNRGYECDDNNGVGKGNPAHTGCVDDPGGDVCTSWSIAVTIDNTGTGTGTVTDGTNTTAVDVTWTYNSSAARTLSSAATNDGSAITSGGGTRQVSFSAHPGCAGSYTVTFHKGGNGNCTSWTVTAAATGGSITAPSDLADGSHIYNSNPNGTSVSASPDGNHQGDAQTKSVAGASDTNCSGSVSFSFAPKDGCTAPCGGSLPDCDNDGIPDASDLDSSTCVDPEPLADCDEDGIPDAVDSDNSACDPDEVLPLTLCPDGSVMPASGECDESVLPDFVLGIRLNRDPVAPAVLPNTLQAAPEGVAGAVLPFTGGSLLPFLMVSMAMVGVGGASMIRRKK